ncbi:hypothetical protein [Thermoactinospora rubra]|uniref:hypothetical protein n=1 Tax=Thermoactinospora rubra TaxID=1088767 RepID=UPI00118144D9|nr:hypothetical protein [Thermoactinospora rubra]
MDARGDETGHVSVRHRADENLHYSDIVRGAGDATKPGADPAQVVWRGFRPSTQLKRHGNALDKLAARGRTQAARLAHELRLVFAACRRNGSEVGEPFAVGRVARCPAQLAFRPFGAEPHAGPHHEREHVRRGTQESAGIFSGTGPPAAAASALT